MTIFSTNQYSLVTITVCWWARSLHTRHLLTERDNNSNSSKPPKVERKLVTTATQAANGEIGFPVQELSLNEQLPYMEVTWWRFSTFHWSTGRPMCLSPIRGWKALADLIKMRPTNTTQNKTIIGVSYATATVKRCNKTTVIFWLKVIFCMFMKLFLAEQSRFNKKNACLNVSIHFIHNLKRKNEKLFTEWSFHRKKLHF